MRQEQKEYYKVSLPDGKTTILDDPDDYITLIYSSSIDGKRIGSVAEVDAICHRIQNDDEVVSLVDQRGEYTIEIG